jgi:hypothetical protein
VLLARILYKIHIYLGQDCNPTVLWTGNGYHVYIVLGDAFPLEHIYINLEKLPMNPQTAFLYY